MCTFCLSPCYLKCHAWWPLLKDHNPSCWMSPDLPVFTSRLTSSHEVPLSYPTHQQHQEAQRLCSESLSRCSSRFSLSTWTFSSWGREEKDWTPWHSLKFCPHIRHHNPYLQVRRLRHREVTEMAQDFSVRSSAIDKGRSLMGGHGKRRMLRKI
jgi:hypothetical protein